MKSIQLLMLLCLLLGICSCTQESVNQNIQPTDIIGHWNITDPSGVQFIEFVSEAKVFIGDRGAIGEMDVSHHYYHGYSMDAGNNISDLPSGSEMINLRLEEDILTFDFVNQQTGFSRNYCAHRESKIEYQNYESDMLNKTWVTVEENGKPLDNELQKMAYFSKAGIYFLKDVNDKFMEMYSWHWSETPEQVCYSNYQRPTFIPQVTCMSFLELTEDSAIFEVNDTYIKMVPSLD